MSANSVSPPSGGTMPGVEERAGIGDDLVLAVGVEPHAGAAQAQRLAVLLGIADDPDFGMVGQVELATAP